MNEMQTRQSQNNEVSMPEVPPPVISRQRALAEFEAILPLDAPERVLNVHGGGGLGKTWFLKDLRVYCEDRGLLRNKEPIDLYDTAHHRVSGLITSVIQELDPEHEHFGPYLKIRAEFDQLRAQGFGGRALEEIGKRMDSVFLMALQELGAAHQRPDGKKGVVLLLDTFEVVKDGRVGYWLLEDLLGPTENVCATEENPPPIVATRDIAVVIAGRPRIDESRTQAPIRFFSPGNFSPEEIGQYVQEVFGHYEDLPFDAEDMETLISWIVDRTGGVPVVVALALDLANLYITAYRDTPALGGEGLLSVLREAEGQGDLATGLIEQIVGLLGTVPEQQWAVLYMAHLRRRFTQRLYSALQGKLPSHIGSLSAFKHLYMTKYRHLQGTFRLPPEEAQQFEEATVSLHDWIRERTYRRYWQGSIPVNTVVQGRSAGIFPPDLDDLWNQACDWESAPSEIPCENLQSILRWLDDKAVEFYEARRQQLRDVQAQVDSEADPSRWVEYEYQQYALMAEQLLYELDRDLEAGWRHWRRAYYEAFESYQQGYCEQLEMTVLSAWDDDELQANPRKRYIRRMVEVRQNWWRIQYSPGPRREVIAWLHDLLRQNEAEQEEFWSELLADIHAALGWAYSLEGDNRQSLRHRQWAADIYRELNLPWSLAFQLDFLGYSLDLQGDFRRADEAWREASEIACRHEPPDRYRLASVAMKWAYSLNLRGESGSALGYAKVAETLLRELGDMRSLGLALNYQGRIYQAAGKFEHAQRALDEAQTLCNLFGGPDDRVRLQISWGEFYRRRAKSEDAQEDDFEQAHQALAQAIKLAAQEKFGNWQAEAEGELGALFRDLAKRQVAAERRHKAIELWEQAEEKLNKALDWAREQEAWFKVADLLDDLCDVCADQYWAGVNGRQALEAYLLELKQVAQEHNYLRYISQAAERQAELYWKDGRYAEAVEQYVQACAAVGLQTHAGLTFRSAYDRLVGVLEDRLRSLPDRRLRADLASRAIYLWAQTKYVREHQQFTLACRRVLHPAQSWLDGQAADTAFDEGRYDEAFRLYVQACYQIGRITDASHDHYLQYMDLVSKLERRFYDLRDLKAALHYSQYVEAEWHRLEQTIRHPAVLEVCQRAQEMARLVQEWFPGGAT